MNVSLELVAIEHLIELLKEFEDIFTWTYKDLRRIPLKIFQHWIEIDTTVPHAHQARYRLNLNYAPIVKQNINKLLVVGFIKSVKEANWLSLIEIIPKKNGKLKIFVNF